MIVDTLFLRNRFNLLLTGAENQVYSQVYSLSLIVWKNLTDLHKTPVNTFGMNWM